MRAFTKKTGWVPVLKDDVDHLGMWLCVPGYTFYLVAYQEILAVEDTEVEEV